MKSYLSTPLIILFSTTFTGTFKCSVGWPRTSMALYSGALALVGVLALACFAQVAVHPGNRTVLDAAKALFGFFILGAIGSTWVANILIMQRPRR